MRKKLKIHCFMHVPFEGPGKILDWIGKHGHSVGYTRFWEGEDLPDASQTDLLVIMGGPMNVFDYHVHPWMEDEIAWVREFIDSGKPALGICLGAQILATALGSEVYPGDEKEIGWHNLRFLPTLGDYKVCRELPATRSVFHWHGDTFDIPRGAARIAESQCFPNQGFIYDGRILAMQFHLEVGKENVEALIENCGDELVKGPYIQSPEELLDPRRFNEENPELLFRFLDYLASRTI